MAPGDRARFESHLASDPGLAAEVAVMRAVRTGLGDAPRHERAEAVWDQLAATIDAPPQAANQNRLSRSQLVRYAAVALVAVVSWETALAPFFVSQAPIYRAVTETEAGRSLSVRFAEDATMSQITELLVDLDASISDGPSAIGLVRLSFSDEAQLQQALETLRARTALVDFVQAP
ncbi:MAG: hypothetical protein AAF676_10580 [Pseudomonadota bacterium]